MAERSLSRVPVPPRAVSKVGLAAVVMVEFRLDENYLQTKLKRLFCPETKVAKRYVYVVVSSEHTNTRLDGDGRTRREREKEREFKPGLPDFSTQHTKNTSGLQMCHNFLSTTIFPAQNV
jgi:hypothetical protein